MSLRRVLHIITGFGTGGAERMLVKILAAHDGLRQQAVVVGLGPDGPVGEDLRRLGVPVVCIGLASNRFSFRLLSGLAGVRRQYDPGLVHGWMYHGMFAAQITAKLGGPRLPVIWNVRQSLKLENEKRFNVWLLRLLAPLSRHATCIVYNSHQAVDDHSHAGFDQRCRQVIPNGFDTGQFRPNPAARAWVRQQLGLPAHAILIGISVLAVTGLWSMPRRGWARPS